MDIYTGITKEIMANSYMEITNPDFNKLVLNKVLKRQKSRLILSHIFFYLFTVAATAGIILIRTNGIDSIADIIINAMAQLGKWFLTNEFVILPIFILLMIKGAIDLAWHRRVNN
jgi:hypothetical protein